MKTCLVVEDSSLVRELTARIIRDIGLDPREAETPGEAVEKCRAAMPDVILLDWDLPSLGALDVLHGIGAIEADPRPPIVLLATENDPQQFLLAKAAGAAFHVLKPFDRESLFAVLIEAGIIDASGAAGARAAS